MAKPYSVSPATVQRIWDGGRDSAPSRGDLPSCRRIPRSSRSSRMSWGCISESARKGPFLSVDEKSQIQALDRTQPGLPMKKGRCSTLTHDYKRHGTTTLFAALSMLDGAVIGACHGRHRHQEFLKFLRQLNRTFPAHLDLHLILDNYGTHKHPNVRAWLDTHSRFKLHFRSRSGLVVGVSRTRGEPAPGVAGVLVGLPGLQRLCRD